jgi:hypothetical protein
MSVFVKLLVENKKSRTRFESVSKKLNLIAARYVENTLHDDDIEELAEEISDHIDGMLTLNENILSLLVERSKLMKIEK